ncbi:g796 [Coccomyxa viridis]|uniref:Coiled-coil domain-containing protein 86 n=1 Tax=Coccomyxa viridis TaxID=1274662 RepID=A0ABP1FLX4_9CHLO
MADAEVPVPPQYKDAQVIDFRNAMLGPRGYRMSRKRKIEEKDEQAEMEANAMQEADTVGVPVQTSKRQKLNIVGIGKGSGRSWKEPSQRASSVKNPILTSSWEKKMQDKAARQHFKEVKQVAIDARKQKLQKVRKQRADAKQRKEENQRKSMVVQAVTNPKTLKKMMASKKDRKKLMKADTLKSVG